MFIDVTNRAKNIGYKFWGRCLIDVLYIQIKLKYLSVQITERCSYSQIKQTTDLTAYDISLKKSVLEYTLIFCIIPCNLKKKNNTLSTKIIYLFQNCRSVSQHQQRARLFLNLKRLLRWHLGQRELKIDHKINYTQVSLFYIILQFKYSIQLDDWGAREEWCHTLDIRSK